MLRKAKSTPKTHWNQRQKLVEEFIELDREIDAIKPKLLRHEKLRDLILSWHSEIPPEDEVTVSGKSWDILITCRDKLRTVTLDGRKKLFRIWGARDFIAKANVFLKSLSDDELGLYTVQAMTGPRHLHVVAKGLKAARPAA